MDKGIQVEARTHEVENAFTDKVACGWACVRAEMCSNERLPTCEKGLSPLQINILTLVFRLGAKIKPYAYLARQLEAQFGMTRTPESIRGVVNRLAARGYLRHRLAREGTLRGVRFSVIEELLCPALVNPVRAAACDVHYAARSGERQTHQAIPSILEEKERKNLSISSQQEEDKTRLEALTEEDIKFHWPKLAGYGFSTDQIRQIIQRLGQKEKSFPLSNILPGLNHAEWELERDLMKDAEGVPVRLPLNWVFNILAKQGYYPRPSGYISPQEQAELDAAEERKRAIAAKEQRLKAECDAWIAALSLDERCAILGERANGIRMPDDVALRNYFRAEIWPKLQNGGAE